MGHEDGLLLADTMYTVDCLILDGGVPPAIHLRDSSAPSQMVNLIFLGNPYHEDMVRCRKLRKIVRYTWMMGNQEQCMAYIQTNTTSL